MVRTKEEQSVFKTIKYLKNIRQEQEHEVIKALEKIKSNTIEELKELGVEM